MILLYNFLLILTSFFWFPWMIFRARRRRELPDWSQRAGDVRMPAAGTNPRRIWLHAVSVGEVMASLPVLADLRKRLPGWEIVLSVTTSSGHETAKTKAEGLYDHLIYAPIDLLRFTVRAMVRIKPAALVIMETELWYSLLWSAREIGTSAILANGRISDRSFRRSRPFSFFYREVFSCFDRVLMQTEQDKERAVALGAKNVEVFGNTKYQEALDALGADPAHWRNELGLAETDFVLFVGSTRGEEDESTVLEGIAKAFPKLEGVKVIWAPRHLERTADLARRIEPIFGVPALRSKGERRQVVLLDTYGELGQAYCVADLVIIGGGFANLGGQNLIQPLAHGKPVIHGPHMQNFRHAVEQAKEAGASLMVQGSEELAAALIDLKSDPQKRKKIGKCGAAFVRSHSGASERIGAAIAEEAQKAWDARERDRIDKEKRRKLREAQQKQKGK